MLLITCPLLKEEVLLAQRECAVFPPTLFLPESVHERPSSLPQTLEALTAGGEVSGPLLLAGGWCGHGLAGYRPPLPLVVPKASDCLELLLFPQKKEKGVYYLTGAWLQSEKTLPRQYQQACAKHGEQAAARIFGRVFAGYHTLCLLENPVRPCGNDPEDLRLLARLFRLELKKAPSGGILLQKLLRGEWEEHFHVFPAGEPVAAFY
ncbi:MAG: DUF1638 domain-containing protein [Clostridiales bacterium]|nr:DUF1638 domain-containing protein [Clostridiales bacterium]